MLSGSPREKTYSGTRRCLLGLPVGAERHDIELHFVADLRRTVHPLGDGLRFTQAAHHGVDVGVGHPRGATLQRELVVTGDRDGRAHLEFDLEGDRPARLLEAEPSHARIVHRHELVGRDRLAIGAFDDRFDGLHPQLVT